jgi:hypothetical protein
MKQQPLLKRRRNFFPALLLALLFWLFWGGLVYFLAPDNEAVLIGFYFLLFMACFLTASLIFANSRRGLITALGVIAFLLLRSYQLGNLLNIGLLLGILISLNLYLAKH